MAKTYIEKFIENKKVLNSVFTLSLSKGEAALTLEETVSLIQQKGKSGEVKKTLKLGKFRNAEMVDVLEVFESMAFNFMLEQHEPEREEKVKWLLKELVRRKKDLYIGVEEENGIRYYELILKTNDKKAPFLMKENIENGYVVAYTKKGLIEKLLSIHDHIVKVY